MRFYTLALLAVLLAGCDSQGTPSRDALVGAWTADSSGTAETVTPTFTGPVVNFVGRPTGGQAVISGEVNATLRFAQAGRTGPRGYREATFTSFDLNGPEPTVFPYYRLSLQGDSVRSSFRLFVQPNGSSSTYEGYLDGPPLVITGDRVTFPSVLLYELGGGRPPITLEGGSFTFPTVAFVAGRPITLRREIRPDNNPNLDSRYVLGGDGSYEIQGYQAPDVLSVYEEGQWEADETTLTLRLGDRADGRTTRFTYTVSPTRLVLLEPQPTCEGPACLDGAAAELGLPSGSISRYERSTVLTFRK
ncbi:MAG TPA: hypothetical protein VF594_09090 [Rubricoccaceae bacterium]|jgi:hypothetical protein